MSSRKGGAEGRSFSTDGCSIRGVFMIGSLNNRSILAQESSSHGKMAVGAENSSGFVVWSCPIGDCHLISAVERPRAEYWPRPFI